MATNIVCSDTYIDAFLELDKKTQKKSLETIRLMRRSLRSDSLKIEKLNTRLNFKSARVTQDFRVIFTQSGNTVLFVYIGRHEDAYFWADKRLKGFDTADVKPVYEYFEQAKAEDFDAMEGQGVDLASHRNPSESFKDWKPKVETEAPLEIPSESLHCFSVQGTREKAAVLNTAIEKPSFRFWLGVVCFLLGVMAGAALTTGFFMFYPL